VSLQLFALSGRDVGRSFQVDDGGGLGRGETCAVRLTDRSVSREHARLEERSDGWYVVDVGSRNGLWVGGDRVAESRVEDLSEFRLGEVRLRVRLQAGADLPADLEPAPKPDSLELSASSRAESVTMSPDRLQLEVELEEEIRFEEEIELAAAPPGRAEPTGVESSRVEPSRRDQELARAVRATREAGLWTGDLGQRPGWMRLLLVLLALGLAASAAWGAFRLVVGLRGG